MLLNISLILAMPFIFLGFINRVKAFWAGRRGAPLLQPLYDFIRLVKKGEVISVTTTSVFQWAPVAGFTATLAAATLAPMAGAFQLVSFEGDFILFIYLLALAKFFSIAGAMDTGSSFEGMGASREAVFSALVEPAFFVIMGALIAVSGWASFSSAGSFASAGTTEGALAAAMAAAAMLIMAVTEGCRVPVDDPNTHLELTMIHEVMVLDNSGPAMALINYTAGLKMYLVCSLLAVFVLPPLPPVTAALLFGAVVLLCAFIIGCVESLVARLRMTHVPQFIFFMSTLAVACFCVAFIFVSGVMK